MSRRIGPLALSLAVALSAGACVSTPKDRSSISLRRSNLSLAFTDPSLKEPAPLDVVQRIIVVPPLSAFQPGRVLGPAKVTIPEVCPATPERAAPEKAAFLSVSRPKPGTYLRVNEGTITVGSGTVDIKLPYPPITTIEVRNVRDVVVDNVAGVRAVGENRWTHFEVVEQIVPGVSELIEYRFDEFQVQLVRRETTTAETGTSVFTPNPPIEVLALANPGTRWTAAGVDASTRVSRAVSGVVEGPRRTALCGQVVETIPAQLTIQDVAAGSGVNLGGTADKPLVQFWLPQYGGLIAREVRHTTEFIRTPEGVVRVSYDVTSKLRTTEPVK